MGDPHKATTPAPSSKPPSPGKLISDAKDADAFFNDLAAADKEIANRWRSAIIMAAFTVSSAERWPIGFLLRQYSERIIEAT